MGVGFRVGSCRQCQSRLTDYIAFDIRSMKGIPYEHQNKL